MVIMIITNKDLCNKIIISNLIMTLIIIVIKTRIDSKIIITNIEIKIIHIHTDINLIIILNTEITNLISHREVIIIANLTKNSIRIIETFVFLKINLRYFINSNNRLLIMTP